MGKFSADGFGSGDQGLEVQEKLLYFCLPLGGKRPLVCGYGETEITQPGLFLSLPLLQPAVRWDFNRPMNDVGITHLTCHTQKEVQHTLSLWGRIAMASYCQLHSSGLGGRNRGRLENGEQPAPHSSDSQMGSEMSHCLSPRARLQN